MDNKSIEELKDLLGNKKVNITITKEKLDNIDKEYAKLYNYYEIIAFEFDPIEECTYVFGEFPDGFFMYDDTELWDEVDEKIFKLWKKLLENEEKYVIR